MTYTPDPYQQQGHQQGYGQQSYGQQPYGQPYGVAYPSYGYGSPYYGAEPESKGPGATALIMGLVALAISLGLSVWGGYAYADIVRELGTDFDTENVPPHLEGKFSVFGMSFLAQIIPTILGIVALVLSGRAMGKPGSKGLGIFGLIVALTAPIVSFIVFMAIVIPATS